MRPSPLLVALSLVVVVFAGAAAGDAASARYIVGYAPKDAVAARLAIEAAGGEVHRTNEDLGFAVATTNDPGTFEAAMGNSPHVQYVERDDAILLTGGQWNGGQWNGAQWNGAQWNGAQWNGGQWNGAQWNDAALADVSEAQRQAAKWTEAHFQADSTNKMKWAGEQTDPGLVWQWAPWATDANHAWSAGATGTGSATLCVLDSGVAWDHPDLAPNMWTGPNGEHGWNAMQPSRSAYDDAGHGTHIAGVAAASVGDGHGVAGVGNVRIMAVKVLDSEGRGTESDLAFGIWWCASRGADVAVMALSVTEADSPTLLRALKYAADRDVLMLASAGNTGEGVQFPARDARVVAVSAVDGDLALAGFSSRGDEVELAAPGVHVLGPFLDGGFVFGSGTSQAVAYAAGLAALVRDAHPELTAEQARARLAQGAVDVGEPGRDAQFGHGIVDVRATLAS